MALEGDVRMHEGRRDIMVDVGGIALTRTYGWYADNTGFASRSLDRPTLHGHPGTNDDFTKGTTDPHPPSQHPTCTHITASRVQNS